MTQLNELAPRQIKEAYPDVESGQTGLVDKNKNIKNSDPEDGTPYLILQTKLYGILYRSIWLFPLAGSLLVPFLCITTYLASVYNGHVAVIFPFISDTGTTSPEADHFSQLMDITAIVNFISGYARYRQLKYIIAHLPEGKVTSTESTQDLPSRLSYCNLISWLIYSAAMFGYITIGNFRAGEVILGHIFGVSLALGGCFIYGLIMIYMCSKLSRHYNIESRPISMMILLAIAAIAAVGCGLFILESIAAAGVAKVANTQFRLHWSSDQPGYRAHLLSTVLEWICINTCGAFLLCNSRRMRLFTNWPLVFKAAK